MAAKIFHNRLFYVIFLLIGAAIIRFGLMGMLEQGNNVWLRIGDVMIILSIGVFILRGTANIIEETTDVLHERTKLAGGLLQSLGTAFPDMVLGVVAAVMSLKVRSTDYLLSINFAIIAAATTFGSNIYNIGHAVWSLFRQNLANKRGKSILMFPGIKKGGNVKPISEHPVKPSLNELDTAIEIINALTVLTAAVAVSMVIFGQIKKPIAGINGDLYQFIRPAGFVIFLMSIFIIYRFRKTERSQSPVEEIVEEEKYYKTKSSMVIWFNLLIAGAAILLTAEIMVRAIETFCDISGLPFIIAGVLAGMIGCLGEMIVVHNFVIHPKGRVGDAVVGVAMDNVITVLGASVVAMMGGIFLGGNALILIFVIILTLNGTLIWQISNLKNSLFIARK